MYFSTSASLFKFLYSSLITTVFLLTNRLWWWNFTHTRRCYYCLRDFIFYRNLQKKLTLLFIFKRVPKIILFERYWKHTHSHTHAPLLSAHPPPSPVSRATITQINSSMKNTWRFFSVLAQKKSKIKTKTLFVRCTENRNSWKHNQNMNMCCNLSRECLIIKPGNRTCFNKVMFVTSCLPSEPSLYASWLTKQTELWSHCE